MSEYRFTPAAVDALFEIWSYIAGDNLDAANRAEAAIYSACTFLADSPFTGRVREDLTPLPVRFWLVQPFRNCWIVYDAKVEAATNHSHLTSLAKYCGYIGLAWGAGKSKSAP